MKIKKVRIRNFKSIKDSGEINFDGNIYVLAGQNESGKSSVLEALSAFENQTSEKDNLNFELEKDENFKQQIAVTFSNIDELFYSRVTEGLFQLIKTENPNLKDLKVNDVLDIKELKRIKEFTIETMFDFSNTQMIKTMEVDTILSGILMSTIKKYKTGHIDSAGGSLIAEESYLDIELYESELAEIFWQKAPNILFFNDFTTILPDRILVDDLEKQTVQGQKAVKNLEKLLKTKFADIARKQIPLKNSTTESESQVISANFQKDWQQKIFGNNKVNIKFFIENNEDGEKEICFFIETKDNEYLAPRKRSKGMIWFLSLWLELLAQENDRSVVLLFDEPGHHLHIKANKDMLSVFHRLVKKGHQIIYSTHSPSLIEIDNLHNIGLVINNIKEGTLVEPLTTSKIDTSNKRDALQPVAEAMGLEPLKDFSVLSANNVIVEGLSDFWYFSAMRKLLKRKISYQIIPSIGIKINNVFPLISFCVGYGLNWLLIMENGENPSQTRQELKEKIFNNKDDETDAKVKLLTVKEVENLFTVADLRMIDSKISTTEKREPALVVGKGRKILFAKQFLQKVDKGEIELDNLDPQTVSRFGEIFDWIEEKIN